MNKNILFGKIKAILVNETEFKWSSADPDLNEEVKILAIRAAKGMNKAISDLEFSEFIDWGMSSNPALCIEQYLIGEAWTRNLKLWQPSPIAALLFDEKVSFFCLNKYNNPDGNWNEDAAYRDLR